MELLSWWIQILLSIIIIILSIAYYYFTSTFNYWRDKNVEYIKPYPVVGTLGPIMTFTEHYMIHYQRLYNKYKKLPYIGVYQGKRPSLLILDPDIAKNILIKDFSHFVDHGFTIDEKADPLEAKNLFNMEGHRWKEMRAKLSPTFSSGRLKTLFPLLLDVSKQLENKFETFAQTGEIFEAKEILALYTTDVIGSCAFGINCNSIQNPDCEFRVMGKRLVESSPIRALKGFLIFFFPEISQTLNLAYIDKPTTNFFRNLVRNVIDHRMSNGETRNDFMQLLIELKENGRLSDDSETEGPIFNPENGELYANFPNSFTKWTHDDVTAQAMVFFFAGLETASSALSFVYLELARNPDIQENARRQIEEVLQLYDNKITYNALQDMHYLDCIIKETLRKYPPLALSQRKCNRNYIIPSTKLQIEENIQIIIPIHAIHNDPDNFPEPELFKPERFLNHHNNNKLIYLPFGEGPRMCIGNRFAIMQLKLGLISVLRKFNIILNNKTEYPPSYNKSNVILNTEKGIWIQLTNRH